MRRTFITTLVPAFLSLLATRGIASAATDTTDDEENFREDVILCEVAVARAAACCPGLSAPPKACLYDFHSSNYDCGGCSAGNEYSERSIKPVLDLSSSRAIARASCEELAAADGCNRLAEQLAKPNETSFSSGSCY